MKKADMKKYLGKVEDLNAVAETAAATGVDVPKNGLVYLAPATNKDRKAAVKKAVKAASKDGNATIWVPIYALGLDMGYHRDPRKLQNRPESIRLEEEFALNRCEPLMASYREDTKELAVMDGGRRLLSCVKKGIEMISVRIFLDMSVEDEAETFADQNLNRIMVSAIDKHQARLVAQGRSACIVEALCRSVGITVTTKSVGVQRPLRAIVTAADIVETFGKESLAWIFGIMDSSRWLDDPACAAASLSARFLRAFANVYAEGELSGTVSEYLFRLVNVLRRVDTETVEAYAKLQNPHMTEIGRLTVTLKDIARGGLTANTIYKLAKKAA